MWLAMVEKVECVGGCGSGDASTLGVIGLVIGLMSLALALYAVKLSQRSADAADESLKMAREEHAEFMKDLRAQAEFTLSVTLDNELTEDGVIETAGEWVRLNWSLGFDNKIGEKVALGVGINFLVPDDLINLTWRTQHTGRVWGSESVQTSPEELPATDGTSYPVQYIGDNLDRLDRTSHHVRFASAQVDSPPNWPGEERIVPVHFKVWSDDLSPNEEGERARWIGHETTIRRTA